VERRQLFRRLRQLRLVQYNSEDDMDSEESWLSIQPAITSFVTDEVLRSLMGDDDAGQKYQENNAVPSALFADEADVNPEGEDDQCI
jgi:hypothetical protein